MKRYTGGSQDLLAKYFLESKGSGASGCMGLAVRGAKHSSQPRTMWPETPRI